MAAQIDQKSQGGMIRGVKSVGWMLNVLRVLGSAFKGSGSGFSASP
jgi:hypothetical protein